MIRCLWVLPQAPQSWGVLDCLRVESGCLLFRLPPVKSTGDWERRLCSQSMALKRRNLESNPKAATVGRIWTRLRFQVPFFQQQGSSRVARNHPAMNLQTMNRTYKWGIWRRNLENVFSFGWWKKKTKRHCRAAALLPRLWLYIWWKPLWCGCLQFLDFLCLFLWIVLSLLGIPLARLIPFPLPVLLLCLLESILLLRLLPRLLQLLSPSFLLVCSSLLLCLAFPSVFLRVVGPRSWNPKETFESQTRTMSRWWGSAILRPESQLNL